MLTLAAVAIDAFGNIDFNWVYLALFILDYNIIEGLFTIIKNKKREEKDESNNGRNY